MRKSSVLAVLLVTFLAALETIGARADIPTFSNLVSSQVNDITTDFASSFMHSSASPPSSLDRFGFELGAVVGATKTRRLSGIAGSNLQALPHGGLLFIGHTPWIVLEAKALPQINRTGISFESYSGGLRRAIIGNKAGFTLAGRAHYTLANIGYASTVLGEPINVAYSARSLGGDLIAGYRLLFIEFFGGAGMVYTKSSISVSGRVSIFDITQFPGSTASTSVTGLTALAGFQFFFPLLNLAVEYSNVYGNHRGTAKLALRI